MDEMNYNVETIEQEIEYDVDGIPGPKGDKGDPGEAGHSPVITTTKSGKTTTILADGQEIGIVLDGEDGAEGHSPVVTASKSGGTTTISVDGEPIATINDGVSAYNFSDANNDGHIVITEVIS